MTDVEMVQSLACCSVEDATAALTAYVTVEAAVDSLLAKPTVSGEKHMPIIQKAAANDREQEERCAAGRALMDKLTVVSSAAHSKIRSGQSLAGGVTQAEPSAPADEQS